MIKYISKTYLQCAGIMALMVWVLGLLLDFSFVVRPMYYVRCIMDGSVLALPVLFVPIRAKKPVAIALCILLAALLVTNYGYYQFFGWTIPLNFYKLGGCIDRIVVQAFFGTLKTGFFILLPLLLLFFIACGKEDKYRWKVLAVVLVTYLFTVCVGYVVSVVYLKLHNMEVYNRYDPQNHSDKDYFTANGLIPFVLFCPHWKDLVSEEEYDYKKINTSSLPRYTDNSYAYAKDKSLIILFVESLNGFVINYKIDGKEVCPNLNRIYNDSTSISAKFKQNEKASSEAARLVVNSGLEPLIDNFSWLYVTKFFPSLAKSKHWGHSVVVSPERKGFEDMTKYYGYKEYVYEEFFKEQYNVSWVTENILFDYALKNINSWSQPFIAQMATLVMHGPFTLVKDEEKADWIMKAKEIDEITRNYLASVKYFDDCLGEFLDGMRKKGKYDDCVIAVMGDHCTHKGYVKGCNISEQGDSSAIVILNSGCPVERIPRPKHMQQIDIYPTLLDLIGGNKYGWKGLGCSIFRGDEVRDDASRYTLSRQLILSDYFLHHDFKE